MNPYISAPKNLLYFSLLSSFVNKKEYKTTCCSKFCTLNLKIQF